MGILDRLSEGAEKVAKQAEKALEQGKTKVEGLQFERQMDGLAKKLGYLELDAFRGRQVDAAARQSYLDELVTLENQIAELESAAGSTESPADAPAAAPSAAPMESPWEAPMEAPSAAPMEAPSEAPSKGPSEPQW